MGVKELSIIMYYSDTVVQYEKKERNDEKENLNCFSDNSKKACHAAL